MELFSAVEVARHCLRFLKPVRIHMETIAKFFRVCTHAYWLPSTIMSLTRKWLTKTMALRMPRVYSVRKCNPWFGYLPFYSESFTVSFLGLDLKTLRMKLFCSVIVFPLPSLDVISNRWLYFSFPETIIKKSWQRRGNSGEFKCCDRFCHR